MAFRPPNFNLNVNIWRTDPLGAYATPDVVTVGTLTYGLHRLAVTNATSALYTPYGAIMLFPKLTDVRPELNANHADLVEIPAASHLFYKVLYVGDVGKGYPNEYRFAVGTFWQLGSPIFTDVGSLPVPTPLP